jgi:hypothetical protein
MLLGALAAVYVSACAEDWWGRDTFGPRRLTSLVPFAAVGLAFIFSRAGVKTRAALALGLASWGVFLASAHFSRHRDLSLLLFGRPDPWSPDPGQAPPAVRWIDRWGPLHFAKPGFTFSDTPGWTDRLLGLVVVTLVVAATWLVWRGLHRYRAAQSAAVVGAVGLVVAWTVTLAVVPTNSGSNAAWRAFLDAPLDPARAQPLPSDMSQARDVVIAAAASAAGDRQVLADAIRRLNEGGIAVTEAEAAPAAPATRP